MDELEIGGKRYLSTRRAGREHKYTADYIGQLIRAGKVVGKKVGRAWYVEEASLSRYLNGEPAMQKQETEPVAYITEIKKQAATTVSEMPVGHSQQKVDNPVKTEISSDIPAAKNPFIPPPARRVPVDEERKITIRTPSLRYLSDDTPAIPVAPYRAFTKVVSAEVPTYDLEHVPNIEQVHEENRTTFFSLATIAAAGIITFALTAGVSMIVSSKTIVEEGQSAAAGYTLK